jgi:membrane associated rhomboid family serine protease
VVAVMVALNVVVFLLQQVSGSLESRFANIPFAVAAGQYYRLITAAFLHAGLIHVGLNMVTLVIVGREVESALGRVRFLVLYLASALGGSVCFYLFGSAGAFALGASTATFGLFGALFVLARARRLDTRQIVMLIAFNLFLGLVVPAIDNLGHVGGLLTGAAVAAAYELTGRLRRPAQLAAQALAVTAIVALLATLVTARTPQAQAEPNSFRRPTSSWPRT